MKINLLTLREYDTLVKDKDKNCLYINLSLSNFSKLLLINLKK